MGYNTPILRYVALSLPSYVQWRNKHSVEALDARYLRITVTIYVHECSLINTLTLQDRQTNSFSLSFSLDTLPVGLMQCASALFTKDATTRFWASAPVPARNPKTPS